MPPGVYPRKPLAEWFWAKVEQRDADECWPWLGAHKAGGYGHFASDSKWTGAHRMAYALVKGPIPKGLQIDHLCRNHNCVNPEHLEAVTNHENWRRGIKGILTTHCPRGHEYTPENTYVHQGKRYCLQCKRLLRSRAYRESALSGR